MVVIQSGFVADHAFCFGGGGEGGVSKHLRPAGHTSSTLGVFTVVESISSVSALVECAYSCLYQRDRSCSLVVKQCLAGLCNSVECASTAAY